MYKIFKHKKGIGFDDLLPYVAVVILLIVILLLNINYSAKKKEAYMDVKVKLSSIEAEQKLLDFLEKKVEIDKKTLTVADFIILSKKEEDYNEIGEMMEEYFDPIYFIPGGNSWRTWMIKIELMPEEKDLFNKIGSTGTNQGGLSTIPLANVFLPSTSEGNYIKIELFKRGRGTAIRQ